MTDEERIRRGEEAHRLKNEPLLIEAFDNIERAALEELLSAPEEADQLRRCAADRIRTVRALRAEIETTIAIGVQAARSTPGIC